MDRYGSAAMCPHTVREWNHDFCDPDISRLSEVTVMEAVSEGVANRAMG
jgi:hypothetical protein